MSETTNHHTRVQQFFDDVDDYFNDLSLPTSADDVSSPLDDLSSYVNEAKQAIESLNEKLANVPAPPNMEGVATAIDGLETQPATVPAQGWETQVVPCDYLWLLADFGNIAPGLAESQGMKDGFHVIWYLERDWFPRGKFDEVCFLGYREGKITAGFNGKFLHKFRTEYLAILGLAENHTDTVEWVDYDDSSEGK